MELNCTVRDCGCVTVYRQTDTYNCVWVCVNDIMNLSSV
jgi:hypothetical protein